MNKCENCIHFECCCKWHSEECRFFKDKSLFVEKPVPFKDREAEYYKQYRKEHAEQRREYQREWAKNNPEKLRAKVKRYQEKNKDKIKERNKAYREKKKKEKAEAKLKELEK